MKTVFGFLGFLLMAAVLGYIILTPQNFDAHFKIHDADRRAEVIKALGMSGVAHKVQSDGKVSFFRKDESRINEIQMAVLHQMSRPGKQFYDSHRERRFLQAMEAEGVPYDIVENYAGGRTIFWAREDSEKVQQIEKKLSWDYSMSFYDDERDQRILKALNAEGITYEIVEQDEGKIITWMEKDNENVMRILRENPPLSHLKAKRISGLSRQDCLARDDVVAYYQESGECLVKQDK